MYFLRLTRRQSFVILRDLKIFFAGLIPLRRRYWILREIAHHISSN